MSASSNGRRAGPERGKAEAGVPVGRIAQESQRGAGGGDDRRVVPAGFVDLHRHAEVP
jgi:hypothetical protein